jgi:hypothetical protein
MKSKRLPTVLFAILLGMGMTPCEAQAEESAAASAPVETTLTACVEEDATDALNDDGAQCVRGTEVLTHVCHGDGGTDTPTRGAK